MTLTPTVEASPVLYLRSRTAADLMTPNPVSIRADASVKEAIALLIDRGYSAAPVIDEAGRPVGVLSRTDIIIHDRERVEYVPPVPEYYERAELTTRAKERLGSGFQVEKVETTCVRDIMTPAVFSINPDAPATRVVAEMPALHVHRLFVVDANGVLVGVISALDVLRALQP